MRRILIDADTGIDDSLAILYALASENLHVEGIVTCFGNTSAAQSADNCLRLLQLSGCGYHVPVVIGANCAMDGETGSAPAHIHGKNGIGNVVLPESAQKPLDIDAADFIIRKAEELNGDLVIVTTGRLTNLANALQKDPGLPKKVKRVVTMGGCLEAAGNVSPVAEANVYGDAHAADIVFRAGFHMILVGLDVTMKTFITKRNLEDAERYCSERSRGAVAYVNSAMKVYFEHHRLSQGMVQRSFVHDPLAVLIAEDASLGEYKMLRLGVEYQAAAFKGMLLRDERFRTGMEHDEIAVCIRIDTDKAMRRFFSVFYDNTNRYV